MVLWNTVYTASDYSLLLAILKTQKNHLRFNFLIAEIEPSFWLSFAPTDPNTQFFYNSNTNPNSLISEAFDY